MGNRRLLGLSGLGVCAVLAVVLLVSGGSPAAAEAQPQSAAVAEWNGLSIGVPVVITAEGKYRMWYQGRGLTFYGHGFALGYAESDDGLTWVEYAANPVLEPGSAGAWDSGNRVQPAVIYDEGLYKMWYSGGPMEGGAWQTGYATSTNGIDWHIYDGNPVIASGGPGSWDNVEADGPTVIRDGALLKMWYYGCEDESYAVCSIGYAISNDGMHWTKFAGNPVLLQGAPGEWDEAGVSWPRVIKTGGIYQMWYSSSGGIGYATSTDGILWEKYGDGPVVTTGWDGAGAGLEHVMLDNGLYKMWTTSGADDTRGIGYLESADGIEWTLPDPDPNPLLVKGEAGMIIEVNYAGNSVRGKTTANSPVVVEVSNLGGLLATYTGFADGDGNFSSWDNEWLPQQPDIQPGDTVSATTGVYTALVQTVGAIYPQAWNDLDMVSGTVDAPWFDPQPLRVICEVHADPGASMLVRDVPADGGSFTCDFSWAVNINGGVGGIAGYLEPDGDMVSTGWDGPSMDVYYGTRDGVGGIYGVGHAFQVTVTNSLGSIKATTTITSTQEGGWQGVSGFRPTWSGGDCCTWTPGVPDIQPGDRVQYSSDDGYVNEILVGKIYGWVDDIHDRMGGPIYAAWLPGPLPVSCDPQTMMPSLGRWSTASPDGMVPYTCDWGAGSDGDPYDLQPTDEVQVHYYEPDYDQVIRLMLAGEGAPPPVLYVPLTLR